MATRAKRIRKSTRGLTDYKIHELLTGVSQYPAKGYTGYGNPQIGGAESTEKHISDEMRRDWETHRDQLLKFWVSGEYTTSKMFPDIRMHPWIFIRGAPGYRPWAWWQFDAPVPPSEGETELDYLIGHNLITDDEIKAAKEVRSHCNDH